jgi:hypothetical protein
MAKDKNFPEFEEPCFLGVTQNSGVYAIIIYTRHNNKHRCIYIGSSNNIEKRIMNLNHVYRKAYDKFTDTDVYVYPIEFICDNYIEMEKKLIIKYQPILNKNHKNGKKIY